MKKFLSIVLTLALFISLLPMYGTTNQAEAAGSYFLFPNEKDVKASARTVSSKYVNLTGTINGIVGSSISYKVEQVTASSDVPLNSTQEISTGITTTGNNSITVSNLELFAGMNKITFKGVAGTSTVEEYIYIEYRDSPMLNNLQILFENQSYNVEENGVTMLYSNATTPSSTGNITIVGSAPNASRVTVEINGNSYEFNVSANSTEYRFSTSQLVINKGMNTIKFKVSNSGQIIETTRLVTLYNGEVTHYDEKISDGTNTYDIKFGEEYSVVNTNNLTLTGKAIIPLPLYDVAGIPSPEVPGVDYSIDLTNSTANQAVKDAVFAALKKNITIAFGLAAVDPIVTIDSINPAVINNTSKFVTVSYKFNLSNLGLAYNTPITYKIKAPNGKSLNTSTERNFVLRNGSLAYIADINYLTGFDSTMTKSDPNDSNYAKAVIPNQIKALEGTDIPSSGVEVYSVPMGVELLIANHTSLNKSVAGLNSLIKVEINGKSYAYKVIGVDSNTPVMEEVTKIVNGIPQSYLRVFLQFAQLDKSGTNTVKFQLSGNGAVTEIKTVIFKLQYGPYVKFESIVDGMAVQYDSYKDTDIDLLEKLGGLTGRIMNVANNSDILYKDLTTNGVTKKASVFVYLNNVKLNMESSDSSNPNANLFKPNGITINANNTLTITPATAGELVAIMNKAGENTLKFMFYTDSYSYESTVKFSVVPTNLPVIPADKTDGVYPYAVNTQWPPVGNDAKFTLTNGIYTTKEAEFNVYGTFDFVDLGISEADINATMGVTSSGTNNGSIMKENYIVSISNPNWDNPIKWDLSKEFTVVDKNKNKLNNANGTAWKYNENNKVLSPDAAIAFYYDKDNQSFFFDITGQQMPEDGSPLVYVISVFNAGDAGPRATYRLEINPISIPYTIKSPVEEERIVNQNFVEFIINAPGAESVVVNKIKAEKVVFLDYNSADSRVNAFKAVIPNLGANKDTKISFTITRGDTTITDTITVKYVPTNIPGAQYMTPLDKTHKVFNNSLTLTFPKSTNLIRSEFKKTDDYATQVFNGHNLLFAIANSEDGIVDRHMYDGQAPNYTASSNSTGYLWVKTRFEDIASRYIKASPLYWIDGGLADDPDTTNKFDPIKTGLDPFPFPNIEGQYSENFASRYQQYNRQLLPSNVGQLTLTYDQNIVSSAGTTVTVFRFDPVELSWENIGGVVDTKKGTITVPFTKFGYYVVTKLTRSYNDIIDHSYAREAMEAIYAKGVMNAVQPVNQFGGDRYVTRGEFTRMIVRALDLPLNYDGTLHFTYYPETITNASNPEAIYDYRYIETAARAGIVNGTRPGFFDEDVQLTRQDASVILARALELKLETSSTKAKTQLDKAFKDGANFDFYAIPSVLAIQKKGFIVGKPISTTDPKAGYMFDPKARMLRSDAAIILSRVMADQKKLPVIYN
ncbi:S-layer homology domain-containing protein [Paenibacillus endoradicis]|uniref:S-layer homology domain-containing protein n=1 Tax=Paenibacillus endoradicis TaxID=2972487 RepID=UPI002159952B|nr:S-layer homology domain-containing protein [Paenibacillus endoradicis]MCR8660486.1 S-layer homology domain-containing protein [Paenibacillus endoradicis]